MERSVKPGPCPACGSSVTYVHQDQEWVYVRCRHCTQHGRFFLNDDDGDCNGKPNAIAAWNGIRARVLREAAEIAWAGRHMDRPEDHPTNFLLLQARDHLRFLADRAERGEP